MKLVYRSDHSREVKIGDKIELQQGTATVTYFRPPSSPASSGKVTVTMDGGFTREFYVGVIDALWIGREDQGQ